MDFKAFKSQLNVIFMVVDNINILEYILTITYEINNTKSE